jgi:hypothetical protein
MGFYLLVRTGVGRQRQMLAQTQPAKAGFAVRKPLDRVVPAGFLKSYQSPASPECVLILATSACL